MRSWIDRVATQALVWAISTATGLLALPLSEAAWAGRVEQYFPAAAPGQPTPPAQSAWRINWHVTQQGTGYGQASVWVFDSIEFMKGKNADGTEDWIKILNNLAMVEMYVPYNDPNGPNFYDMQMGFDLARANPSYLSRVGVIKTKIEDANIISEVVDDGLRWMDNRMPGYPVRRGQALQLWGTLVAANYSYVMVYTFSDDGRISVRVGGTAQNYFDLDPNDMHAGMNRATHAHMGAWRMEFDLGAPSANTVEVVERFVDPTRKFGISRSRPFNNNREGGETWEPDRFTVLKVTNTRTMNRHSPPHPVSYMISSAMRGRLRTTEKATEKDFWVTRLVPDAQQRQRRAPELKFIDVPKNVAAPEAIDNRAAVVWHNAALNHMPHGEDFGAVGYVAADGSALLHYTGFDLIPVSLWHKTPFLERGPDAPEVAGGSQDGNTGTGSGSGTGTGTGSVGTGGGTTLTTTLRRGDQGDQVRELQRRLESRGYAVASDGNFGSGTEAAVRQFQQANNLTADGVVGRQTRELLTAAG